MSNIVKKPIFIKSLDNDSQNNVTVSYQYITYTTFSRGKYN